MSFVDRNGVFKREYDLENNSLFPVVATYKRYTI